MKIWNKSSDAAAYRNYDDRYAHSMGQCEELQCGICIEEGGHDLRSGQPARIKLVCQFCGTGNVETNRCSANPANDRPVPISACPFTF